MMIMSSKVHGVNLVVEAQLAFGHAREEGPHLQGAHDLRAHHSAIAVHQQVHALHHVQEHLILLVPAPQKCA